MPCEGPVGARLRERDQHVRELDRHQRSLLHVHAAEHVHPELLVNLDVGDIQVHVTVGHARGVHRRQLRARGPATASSSASVINNLFIKPPADNDTGARERPGKGQRSSAAAQLPYCATLGHLFDEAAMLSRDES